MLGIGNDKILELLDKRGRSLYALLYKMTLCDSLAQELLQELFIKLSSSKLSGVDNLYAYARMAARNLAIDYFRKQKQIFVPFEEGDHADLLHINPANEMIKQEELDKVMCQVRKLKKELQQVIVMRYIEQQSYEDIGQQIGKKAHQVRAICSRAMNKLRDQLNVDSRFTARKEVRNVAVE